VTALRQDTGKYVSSRYEGVNFAAVLTTIERECPFDVESLMADLSDRERAERSLSISQSDLTLIRWALNKRYGGNSNEPVLRSTLSQTERTYLKRYAADNGLPLSQYLTPTITRKLVSEGNSQVEDQEARQYQAARGDLGGLRSYVQSCKLCAFGSTANSEIAALEVQSQRRTFSTYQNRDLSGGDSQRMNDLDHLSCIASCRSDTKCVAYSYDKWNRWCFLKSTVDVLRIEPRSVTGIRGDVGAPQISSDPVIMERYRGKIFRGSGYSTINGSFESCESECKGAPNCIAFTFVKATRRCTLFGETGEYFSGAANDSGAKTQPSIR
jgi:hypothetical protein